jgi:hypothetical protein
MLDQIGVLNIKCHLMRLTIRNLEKKSHAILHLDKAQDFNEQTDDETKNIDAVTKFNPLGPNKPVS